MQYREPYRDDRTSLLALLTALDASPRALRRDDCGDWAIAGKHGQIYADGDGWLIVVRTDESARRWGHIKRGLSFCRIAQDGDDEGALHLNRLPTDNEAELIRDAIRVKRKRHYPPEQLAAKAALAAGLSKITTTEGVSAPSIR